MEDELTRAIQSLCISQGWTLSVAESCTGGQLAACLTRLPGCSQYFLGSIVAYSNNLKTNLLGVREEVLAEHGAVSGPVVEQMAQGMLQLTGSDYSLAVSGIAGPDGGSSEKPVGTIWGAIASRHGGSFIWKFNLAGSRHEIIEKCVENLLSQLRLVIESKKNYQ
jgi:PncC family amidohydrolase